MFILINKIDIVTCDFVFMTGLELADIDFGNYIIKY